MKLVKTIRILLGFKFSSNFLNTKFNYYEMVVVQMIILPVMHAYLMTIPDQMIQATKVKI